MMTAKEKMDKLCELEDKVITKIDAVIDEPMETGMLVDIMKCISTIKKSHLDLTEKASGDKGKI